MIDFVFDFTSVDSWLAFGPTCRLADELQVPVNWLPMCVPAKAVPAKAPEPKENESVSERHARVRAEYMASENARYAERLGVPLKRSGAGVDASLAAAACIWATEQGVGREFAERAFGGFWEGQLDIEDAAAVTGILEDLGAPGFDLDDGAGRLEKLREELEERGVFGIPTYVVEGQMFMGRQHLPMIRWLLTGQQGPGPL